MKLAPFLLPLLLLTVACAPTKRDELVFDAQLGENADVKVQYVEFCFRDDSYSSLELFDEFSLVKSSNLKLPANWRETFLDPANVHSRIAIDEHGMLRKFNSETPKKIEDVRYILFDLLIPTGNELKVSGDSEQPFNFGKKEDRKCFADYCKVSFPKVTARLRLAPWFKERGYSEEVTETRIGIHSPGGPEQMQFAYWPFYENANLLKPAKGLPSRGRLVYYFCYPPLRLGIMRFPEVAGHASYAEPIYEWEYLPSDNIVIKEFCLVTIAYEQTPMGWKFLPYGYPKPAKPSHMSVITE